MRRYQHYHSDYDIDYSDIILDTILDVKDMYLNEKTYCARLKRLRFSSISICLLMLICFVASALMLYSNIYYVIDCFAYIDEDPLNLIFIWYSEFDMIVIVVTLITAFSIQIKALFYSLKAKYPRWVGTFVWSIVLLFTLVTTFLPGLFETEGPDLSFGFDVNPIYLSIICLVLLWEIIFIIPLLKIQSGYPIGRYLELDRKRSNATKVAMIYLYEDLNRTHRTFNK